VAAATEKNNSHNITTIMKTTTVIAKRQ